MPAEPKAKRRKVSQEKRKKGQGSSLKSEGKLHVNLEDKFGVKFNSDVKLLWKWALSASPDNPTGSLKSTLNLTLCGVFTFLEESVIKTEKENLASSNHKMTSSNSGETSSNDGNLDSRDAVELHMIDREWQCPPEFQPCARDQKSLYGLWRDTPTDLPVFIARKEMNKGVITPVAIDLLDLIRVLGKEQDSTLPQELSKLIEENESEKDLKRVDSARRKLVVAKTFNKIGIVVPVSKKDVGYRPLTVTYGELDKMLTKSCEVESEEEKDKILAPFDECVNYIQFANDECDYGMGFELAMCVFAHKESRNFLGTISSMLPLAYDLLGRTLFSKIMKKICKKEENGSL